MNPTALFVEQDNDTLVSQTNIVPAIQSSTSAPLREHVKAVVKEYFVRLDGVRPANLYELFLAEFEMPLLEVVLKYVQNDQSLAAKYLNLSRGTLRKKMKGYGFLGQNGKRDRRKIQDAQD